MRVPRGESLRKPLVSVVTARRGHRPIVERRISKECQQLTGTATVAEQQQLRGQAARPEHGVPWPQVSVPWIAELVEESHADRGGQPDR